MRWVVLLAVCAWTGCGSSSSVAVSDALRARDVPRAVELYAREPRPNPADLRRIAEVVLVHEAGSLNAASRARGFAALRSTGTAGRDLLERLSALRGRPPVRVQALALLARMGDAEAAAELRAVAGSHDPELRAAAVVGFEPARDAAQLCRQLSDPAPAVRAAAAERLLRAPADAGTQLALARAARHDPALAVRLAALRALGGQGPSALPAIEARLEDEDEAARLAAIAALGAADPARAGERFERWLREDPRPESIEAARVLAMALAAPPSAAREQLARALAAPNNALRAQAAVALSALPAADARALALARIAHEAVRSIALWLALALGSKLQDGKDALHALTRTPDLVAAQAHAELARASDPAALPALTALLRSPDRQVRALAIAVIARELGRPQRVRAALYDRDPSVRLAAASAILSATARPTRPAAARRH